MRLTNEQIEQLIKLCKREATQKGYQVNAIDQLVKISREPETLEDLKRQKEKYLQEIEELENTIKNLDR